MSPDARAARAALRRWLLDRYDWLADTELGPQAVTAGECARCDALPRLLPTCGPTAWDALCRDCAAEVGLDAWCDGHRSEGEHALAWARDLPDAWPTVVRLWWVATGEVRIDPTLLADARATPALAELPRLLGVEDAG